MGRLRGFLAVWGWSNLILAGLALACRPQGAPVLVLSALASALFPIFRAGRGAEGTALGSVVLWGGMAVVLGGLAQIVALFEPSGGGRPGAGALAYLSALATLAALISAFNARRPGGGAWAILMGLLVLVFCLPWLEGTGLAHRGRAWGPPRLEAPWSWFFALLIAAGATNYAPTRFGPSAMALAVSVLLAGFLRGRPELRAWMASASPWCLALAIWLADARSGSSRVEPGTDRLWGWFRDHWGVVWALRVQERFNRAADSGEWPARLGWFGLEFREGTAPDSIPDAAEATLKSLLRRFADEGRIEAETGRLAEH